MLCLLTAVLLLQSVLAAADVYDLPKVVAVQKRKYVLNDEIVPQVTYLPLDALYKYVAPGLVYTHYFSDFAGWEVINGNYAFKQSTDLLDTIKAAQFDITSKLHVLDWYVSSNFVYTPLYTKSLLFNRSIVYGEISFVGGPVYGNFDEGNKTGFDTGLILRFYTGQRTSLRFDFRDYLFLGSGAVNHIALTLGLAVNFGGGSAGGGNDSEFGD